MTTFIKVWFGFLLWVLGVMPWIVVGLLSDISWYLIVVVILVFSFLIHLFAGAVGLRNSERTNLVVNNLRQTLALKNARHAELLKEHQELLKLYHELGGPENN